MKLFTRLFLTVTLLLTALTSKGQTDDFDQTYHQMMATLTRHVETAFDLTRNIVLMNDLASDEAFCTWFDAGLPELCKSHPQASNQFVLYAWQQLFECIDICNQFLSNTNSDDKTTQRKRAEGRLLRALYYSYAIDLWGDVPLRKSYSGNPQETRTSRSEVFNFLINELTDIATILPTAADASYGQLTRGAAQLLLARLYLNSEVYTGKARWTEANAMASEVINGGYSLCSDYQRLFMGDNDTNGAQQEMVLPILIDGGNTNNWGNTTYLIASTHSDNMPDCGLSQKWAGVILRNSMLRVFSLNNAPYFSTVAEAQQTAGDERCLMLCNGQTDLGTNFNNGIHCLKYTNLRSDGLMPSHLNHADTDFPLMRLAEAYLISAEADARLNGGVCTANGVQSLNVLRTRAKAAMLSGADLSVIGDEWAREFYMEGYRRCQLIRFGSYSSTNYLWDGKASHVVDLMPIPSIILGQYPNYTQNPGYEDMSIKPEGLAMNTPAFANTPIELKKFQALKFSWQRPTNFSLDDEVTYQLVISTDAGFVNNVYNEVFNENQLFLSTQYLYNCLGNAGIADGATVQLFARVVCHGVASEAVSFSVIRSQIDIQPKLWFLVGADIADGSWNNSVSGVGSSMLPLFVSQAFSGGYAEMTFTDYFGGQGFKGVGTPGRWEEQVGEINGQYWFNDGASGNIVLNGYYTVTLNSYNSSFEAQPLGYTPTDYSSISMIGSFSGWNDDFQMTRTSATSHTWYALLVLDENSELKFRANNNWDNNWGADEHPNVPYGKGQNDGSNIPVKAGAWKVFFNDIDGRYMFLDAETAQLTGTTDSENVANGMYLNKEFAVIGVTATGPIDISQNKEVKVANIEDGNYYGLFLVVSDNVYQMNDQDYTVLAGGLIYLADHAEDKTITVEDGVKKTVFTAKVRGYVIKQDLIVFTESEPFTITLTEPLQTVNVEGAYYYIGSQNGWNMEDQNYPLTRESNLVFSYTWTVPARTEEWFCVVPASAYSSSNFWEELVRPEDNGASLGSGIFKVPAGNAAWNITSNNEDKTYHLVLDFGTTTYTLTDVASSGIHSVGSTRGQSQKVYDLSGRELRGMLKPGLYIRGDRKIVISK